MEQVLTENMKTFDPESGLATAEYAVATIAAVGFAGLLIAILKSETVRSGLEGLITSALSTFTSSA
ncbi:MAG: DUF4244 domain-containing protein [Promicromonosporaceae bacterium]|nr:DUF4244 domain-containing protein [Promicromonosporaceae bacterium]